MPSTARLAQGPRSGRTRTAVLEAAEALFAERGFDATRLEDIAERVGIRRASIVYYFKDKRDLYEAVLGSVFGDLQQALASALSQDVPLLERIEAAVSTWIDYAGARPSVAHILLREVANATPERRDAMLEHTRPFTDLIRKQILERPDFVAAGLARVDPVLVASTVAGPTVFLVAAMPALLPERDLDPTTRETLHTHKEHVLRIVRDLLVTRDG